MIRKWERGSTQEAAQCSMLGEETGEGAGGVEPMGYALADLRGGAVEVESQ